MLVEIRFFFLPHIQSLDLNVNKHSQQMVTKTVKPVFPPDCSKPKPLTTIQDNLKD